MTSNEFQRLKDDVERLRREAATVEGAEGQLLARLEADHGLKSVDEAGKRLKKMKAEVVRRKEGVALALAEYDREREAAEVS